METLLLHMLLMTYLSILQWDPISAGLAVDYEWACHQTSNRSVIILASNFTFHLLESKAYVNGNTPSLSNCSRVWPGLRPVMLHWLLPLYPAKGVAIWVPSVQAACCVSIVSISHKLIGDNSISWQLYICSSDYTIYTKGLKRGLIPPHTPHQRNEVLRWWTCIVLMVWKMNSAWGFLSHWIPMLLRYCNSLQKLDGNNGEMCIQHLT